MHMTDGCSAEFDSQSEQVEQFKKEVREGLSSPSKTLPSKYFYDAVGDGLFQQIMDLPEYYLSRAEAEILLEQASELIRQFNVSPSTHFELIELGAGDGTKTMHLLNKLLEEDYHFHYHPVDISQNALDKLEAHLHRKLPQLKVKQQHGDYFDVLERYKSHPSQKVVLFLGSNLGNLTDEQAMGFMGQLSAHLLPKDSLLLGVDLIKPAEIVLPAYSDRQGITKRFNLNLLHRINTELGGDFQLSHFSHAPTYDEQQGIANSYLRSDRQQDVFVEALGETFHFEKGELIHTELSRKYTPEIIRQLTAHTAFQLQYVVTDKRRLFADMVLMRTA